MAEQRFCVEYAKRGTAGCKKCKDKIMKGLVRIGKVVPNPFTESGGDMKEWYHVKCIFEKFEKARATTKKIEDITDLEGWEELQDEEKELINKHISDLAAKAAASPKKKVQAKLSPGGQLTSPSTQLTSPSPRKFSGFSATKPGPSSLAPATQGSKLSAQYCDPTHKDCLFREFHGFHGDLFLTVKLLLPGVIKSVYNLNDKQIVKLFSRIFNCNQEEMVRDLEQGDVSETIRMFFEGSTSFPPPSKSLLTIQEVDAFLERLSQLTKEDEQQKELEDISIKCTANDLKCIIRLIKHDLKMNSGAKHVLDAVDPNAYDAFKASRNLGDVVDRVLRNQHEAAGSSGPRKILSVEASLMTPVQPMLGDVSETIRMFFEGSTSFPPPSKSLLTIQEVDAFLERLSQLTKEDEQQKELEDISIKCTANDLKCIIRLIKHDLKMNSGAKHVLDAVDPNAYDAFKASRNLGDVVDRVLRNQHEAAGSSGPRKILSVEASLMTPVQPMLAEACKSIEYAMKKCPNGMYSEIKYDGERVQVHKNGDHFSYFSRSLKPVLPHKVAHFKEFIPQAFPGGNSIILDAEVLLIDTSTSKPLPFGSLGVHKKAAFQDAKVCLFVFDCIFFNGVSLMDRPLRERKKFLHENMVEIPNRILFSEMKHVTVAHFKEFIPQAFPGGNSIILDAEVLLIDTSTSKPLPFGSLGVHKKAAFQDAKVCLFVFDCIFFNGVSLMDRPLRERKKFLHENMVEIPNRILFSEMKHVTRAADLADMITRVIREGLEGLVLKDVKGLYEPGKRHWLKVKKDYLNEGAMADTADLVVLGAFYGTGSKGGMMSVFLMGCYDPASQMWCTVTKCAGGHDDATLARLQSELDMVKISKEPSKIPGWLKINKNYYPDFVARDPKVSLQGGVGGIPECPLIKAHMCGVQGESYSQGSFFLECICP
ncbi:UNVERIFIED_CONTAM: hypothetical protein FKN15_075960 [Acipenser sinensis]